jgi:hypothetical protein
MEEKEKLELENKELKTRAKKLKTYLMLAGMTIEVLAFLVVILLAPHIKIV